MVDKIDLYWKLVDKQYDMLKHEESQRATATNIILVLATAVLGVVAWDRSLVASDLPMTIFLLFIGILGVLFAFEYRYTRSWHDHLLIEYLTVIAASEPDIGTLRVQADQQCKKKYFVSSKIPKPVLWVVPPLGVVVLGLVLTWMAIYCPIVAKA
jgi:hypothetical protein